MAEPGVFEEFVQQSIKRFSRRCRVARKGAVSDWPATVSGVFFSMGTMVPMTFFRRHGEESPLGRRASQYSGA